LHLFFYNLFLWTYRIAIKLAAKWNPKARLWVKGRRNIFSKLSQSFSSKVSPLVWIHCSSLGEFEQGRPVLDGIRKEYPTAKILLTFYSPSGYEAQKNYVGADYIFYLPPDSKRNARKFLDIVKPEFVLWIKYDYWYYYLSELKHRNIPAILVSGVFRKDQPFFKWYGRLHRYMLESFSHLLVQNEASRTLLAGLGYSENVTICGDTRFDRVVQIASQFTPVPGIDEFCGNKNIVVAGSTWDADEEEMDHYANTNRQTKFIIAPHEVDEDHLKETEKLFKHSIRYSQWMKITNKKNEEANVLIIDNIGMLSRLYNYATIAFVGGGFGDDGVHNVLEAAVYGKPVVFGPVFEKYIEAIELIDEGGGFTVENALELEELFKELLTDKQLYKETSEASRNYVYTKKGATDKILQFIQEKRLLTN
jgi:3-deoxy-D-manno-octulosonic-acid transferase